MKNNAQFLCLLDFQVPFVSQQSPPGKSGPQSQAHFPDHQSSSTSWLIDASLFFCLFSALKHIFFQKPKKIILPRFYWSHQMNWSNLSSLYWKWKSKIVKFLSLKCVIFSYILHIHWDYSKIALMGTFIIFTTLVLMVLEITLCGCWIKQQLALKNVWTPVMLYQHR